MAKQFRADNIGSLLRPPELLQARARYREGKLEPDQLRAIEDRSILKALDAAESRGRRNFYRRRIPAGYLHGGYHPSRRRIGPGKDRR